MWTTLLSGGCTGWGDEGQGTTCSTGLLVAPLFTHPVCARGLVPSSPSRADAFSASPLQHRCEEVHAACFGDQLFALTYLADSSASAALILPHPLYLVLLDPFSSHLAHRPCFNLPLSAYAKIAFLPSLCSCCWSFFSFLKLFLKIISLLTASCVWMFFFIKFKRLINFLMTFFFFFASGLDSKLPWLNLFGIAAVYLKECLSSSLS